MRIMYNILFEINDKIGNMFDQEFAPMSGGSMSNEVNNWLEEPRLQAK